MNRSYYWDEDTFDNAEIADDENIDEVIETANDMISAYAKVTNDEYLVYEFSDFLWEYYCFNEHLPVARTWRVYGAEGHRQRVSFRPSIRWNFSSGFSDARVILVKNADVTGTNEYSVVTIIRNTAEECEAELEGQLSDGLFEDSRYGEIEEED